MSTVEEETYPTIEEKEEEVEAAIQVKDRRLDWNWVSFRVCFRYQFPSTLVGNLVQHSLDETLAVVRPEGIDYRPLTTYTWMLFPRIDIESIS